MIQIWAFPADPLYCERLNPAERVNDIRHPINLRLFNWRVPALVISGLSEGYQRVISGLSRVIRVLSVDHQSVISGLSLITYQWFIKGYPLWPHAMGTLWGPNFQWNGDQMGTLASRMGTQKAHVCKIDRNKLIRWNIAFIREEKLFFTRTVKLAWDSQVPVVLLQVITWLTLYSGCMDFSRVLKP